MRIETLIKKLEKIKEKHGNFSVFVNNGRNYTIQGIGLTLDADPENYPYTMPKNFVTIDFWD